MLKRRKSSKKGKVSTAGFMWPNEGTPVSPKPPPRPKKKKPKKKTRKSKVWPFKEI